MVQRRGPRLTAAQKADVWRRWREGESLSAIGRALGRIPKMVRYVVAGAGGIPPVPRQRAPQALTLAEREVISRGVARGASQNLHPAVVGDENVGALEVTVDDPAVMSMH